MSSFYEGEKRRFDKMNKFQLPNKYKKMGWLLFIVAILALFGRRFFEHPFWIKIVLRNVIIFSLLVVSLSKEKIEDELIKEIRLKSFRLAFICGVVYSFILPYISYVFDYIKDSESAVIDNGYFQIILSMLLVQIMFFHAIKKVY